MYFLIGFLKFIIIILANVGLGYILCSLIYGFFFCAKPIYIFNHKIPFTPGLLYRKKKWLIKKLTKLVDDYLDFAVHENHRNNYLAQFEDKLFKTFHSSIKQFFNEKPLPKFIKNKLADWSEKIAITLVKKISRELIPYIILSLGIKDKIDLLSKKLDIDLLKKYFNEYVYKYVLWFTYAFFGLIGIYNALLYAILRVF